ncbi:hypothetical protein PAXINDRAFT_100034, partial [Paxillus involutus ATCC 200175]
MWPYKSWVAVVQNFLYVDTVWEDLCKEVQSVQREALVHGWRSRDFDLYLVTEGVVRRHEQLYVQRYRLARTPDKPNLNHFPVDNVDWMAYEKVAGGLWSGVSSQYHLAQEQRTGPKDALALAKEAVRWYDDSDRPLMLDEYTHTWEGMGMVPKDPFDPNLTDCETGEEDSENQGDEEDQEALLRGASASTLELQPTTECLLHLVELSFLGVITLNVNLHWGHSIMKTINESLYYYFQQVGWSFLGGGGAEVRFLSLSRPYHSHNADDTESELEADPEDLVSEQSSADESENDGNDVNADSGSAPFDEESDDGDDWDELERQLNLVRSERMLARVTGTRTMIDGRRRKQLLSPKRMGSGE